MPRLEWIGKEKVVNHHLDVPFKTFNKKYTYNAEESKNMIIHGDNLASLKSLLPKYEGRITCAYLDPPYNTGNEKWVYNDNVNHPSILKWLGDVVGKEGEDLTRHDKWLCMMYPRLKLIQKLLSNEGRVFISIDEVELYSLKLICDEIFGASNFAGQYMWYKSGTPPNLSYKVKRNLEYVLCYEKKKNSIKFTGVQKTSPSDDPFTKPQNSLKVLTFPAGVIHFKGEDGFYKAGVYGTAKFPNKLLNDMIIENGVNKNEVSFENKFIWVQETLNKNIQDNVRINLSKNLVLTYKRESYSAEVPPNLVDMSVGVNTTEEAGKLLEKMFGYNPFDYPKDVGLIKYLLKFVNDKNGIILDCFAGSGTTGQAVLELNKEDGGNRQFIEIELMDYAETITAERAKKVIDGYSDVKGVGGSFSYYELGENIFDKDGNINANISNEEIRQYVYYSETKMDPEKSSDNKYFLGRFNNTDYYLYYENGQNTVLNYDFLSSLKFRNECIVIYAQTCTISDEELNRFGIVFKKIPRDLKKS